jgi:transcriptional regulator with XRE-family HTH domain
MRKTFGYNVKYLRATRQATQAEVAEKCGLFRTYLSRIESGEANPSLTVIVALAEALEVVPSDLLNPSTCSNSTQVF